MYVPNPVTVGALRFGAHCVFAAIASTRADPSRNRIGMAFSYAVLRAAGGWVIGIPLGLVLLHHFHELTPRLMISAFAIPRFVLSALLIHWLFKPRGGRAETILWALLSVAMTSLVDIYALGNHDWLQMTWC